jgi:hypothetical protein
VGVEDNSPTPAAAIAIDVNNSVGKRHIGSLEDEDIPEEVIQFVSENPRIMRRWQSLAHQVSWRSKTRPLLPQGRPQIYQFICLCVSLWKFEKEEDSGSGA